MSRCASVRYSSSRPFGDQRGTSASGTRDAHFCSAIGEPPHIDLPGAGLVGCIGDPSTVWGERRVHLKRRRSQERLGRPELEAIVSLRQSQPSTGRTPCPGFSRSTQGGGHSDATDHGVCAVRPSVRGVASPDRSEWTHAIPAAPPKARTRPLGNHVRPAVIARPSRDARRFVLLGVVDQDARYATLGRR